MRKLYLFVLINILISSTISIRYFMVPGASFSFTSGSFAFISVLSHFFALYLLAFFICLPFLLFNKYVRNTVIATLFTFFQLTLYIDTLVFEQYRFHINQSVIELVLSGQVVSFSVSSYIMMFTFIAITFSCQLILLYLINRRIQKVKSTDKKNRTISISTLLLFIFLLVSHFGHMVAFYYAYSPIMLVKEYIPLFKPLTSKKIMHYFDADGMQTTDYNVNENNLNLHYPKNSLIIAPNNHNLKNIMFIVLDSWRYDTFTQEISPNTYEFVKRNGGAVFNNHQSTGNATRVGIFGLFYGIPGTYWDSFIRNSVPSLFITTLQKLNYNIGVFTSAPVTSPEFHRTAFVTVDKLRIGSNGNSASDSDKILTDDWLKWYKNRDKQRPSFSFLFYDAPHAYDFPSNFEKKFKPIGDLNYMTLNNNTDPLPIFNRYKQSVYYDDYLLKNIYNELEASGALKDTVIVITGDHGQEMNDNKLGYWGHNGNFTDAQTKVPFIIIDSNHSEILKTNVDNITSHEDVIPTLMKNYLHVENNISDYSTGYDLFNPIITRDWLLLSSYASYAVKTKKNIYSVNNIGITHYMDSHNRIVDEKPNFLYIQDAFKKMRYFFE